ncbi:FMN-binding negative transcriptional regulator [Pseudozobellia thermophila]|uniref:Negative transcriptional regulator, PaiB family n=1 Tax=Pseudozobellia thermophila TaxID=192903 RepID=A0A1M6FME7_9FLAO|nr:FMN-binding negative transcriptional regulator [Pseudozobellia thermophila]SHI98852.1 negative transcriptional regulator, PaiB family [Pseudozobellia thermophila]
MYIPDYHKNGNPEEVRQFIKANSFGVLVTHSEGKTLATHIPLELEYDTNGKEFLTGHIAKANEQAKHFLRTEEVLCIFNGPNAYISSSWYQEEEVPTWNYIAVHVYGKLKILDEAETMASLHRLVDTYEAHSKHPVSLKNMSPQTLKQVKGIVGFQIEITDIQARYKLSQNREHDHGKIIEELEDRDDPGSHAIAKAMKKGN